MTKILSYDEAVKYRRETDNSQRLKASVEASTLDPDLEAKIWYVQGKTRLPPEVVEADIDNLYEQARRDEFDYNAYTDKENGAPVFNKWAASSPYHVAVVERDRRNLSLIERQFDSMSRGWDRADAMFELSRIVDRRRDGDEREGDDEIIEALDQIIEADDFGLTGWSSVLVENANRLNIQLEIMQESVGLAAAGAAEGLIAGWAIGAWSGPGSGITALGGAATGLGVGWRVGAFESARHLEQNLAYHEYTKLGATEKEAKRISGYVGAANGLMEMIGVNALVKFIPGSKKIQGKAGKYLVERMFSKPTVAGAHRLLLARYGEVMGTEIFTEVLQESITMAGGEYLKGKMRETGDLRPETMAMTFDEFTSAVSDIAVKTMKGALLLGAIGPGASYIGDRRRARNAQATGAYLKSVSEGSTDLEMVKDKRLIPKVKEFFQVLGSEGPVESIRFELEAWVDYWDSQGQDAGIVSEAFGIDLAALEAEGSDVVLSLETFGEKLAHTEHFSKELWKDARIDPEAMTYREAKDFMADPEVHIERIKADLQETFGVDVSDDFDRIVEVVTNELVSAGKFDKRAAEQQAQLMASVFTSQALRNAETGLTPFDLFVQRFGGLRMDVRETAASPGSVDLTIDPLLDTIRAGNIPAGKEISGDSLVEFVMKSGKLNDEGGELAARNYKELKRGLVSPKGQSLDGMAELAHEAGYIAERDPNLLLEMLDRELQEDNPVYSTYQSPKQQEAFALAEELNLLADYLEMEGIDIQSMSNEAIRNTLLERRTYEQTDEQSLKDLTDLVLATIGNKDLSENYAADLMKLEKMIPRVSEDQDFGDLQFTDRVQFKGRPGTRKRSMQKAFDLAVKKRNSLKKLLDCMGGSQ